MRKLGQISESIKIIKFGDHLFKNFFTSLTLSIGKNLCVIFFSLINFLEANLAELNVTVVIKI